MLPVKGATYRYQPIKPGDATLLLDLYVSKRRINGSISLLFHNQMDESPKFFNLSFAINCRVIELCARDTSIT
jgi:hypothetical protein